MTFALLAAASGLTLFALYVRERRHPAPLRARAAESTLREAIRRSSR
jgi:hypothetical protein